jgi:hypothetical protein
MLEHFQNVIILWAFLWYQSFWIQSFGNIFLGLILNFWNGLISLASLSWLSYTSSSLATWLSTWFPDLKVVIACTCSCPWVGVGELPIPNCPFGLGTGWLGNFPLSLSPTWLASWPICPSILATKLFSPWISLLLTMVAFFSSCRDLSVDYMNLSVDCVNLFDECMNTLSVSSSED